MNIGFTGTRNGLTERQISSLAEILARYSSITVHHGDCVGADEDFNAMAQFVALKIVIHPPTNKVFRAYCVGDELRDEKPYLERNHDIVDECDVLIACPSGAENIKIRSGTWATVRYARKQGKPVIVINPNGDIDE